MYEYGPGDESQMMLDAIVRFGVPFVHRDGLRRSVPLRPTEFDMTLNVLLAERLVAAAGPFVTLTRAGIYVGATGAMQRVGWPV